MPAKKIEPSEAGDRHNHADRDTAQRSSGIIAVSTDYLRSKVPYKIDERHAAQFCDVWPATLLAGIPAEKLCNGETLSGLR